MSESPHPPLIEKYAFGSMRISGRTYYADLTISEGEIARWWRGESHLLQSADIDAIVALKPAVLVVGTGNSGNMQVSPEATSLCEEAGVELVVERTGRAAERYNELVRRGTRTVAAAFHLTC
jgi:hypothetical protein